MNLKLPNISWDNVTDYLSASRDSTGQMRDDNPLNATINANAGLDDYWCDGYEAPLPKWFYDRVTLEFDNCADRGHWKDWSYIVLNDDQILCLSPVYFQSWQLIVLLTRDTGGYKDEGPYVWSI